MGRIMGLDIGEKRIGVAVSDPLMLTAQGVETYQCRSREADIEHLRKLAADYSVSLVVAGLPVNMNNTLGPQAEYVQDFMQEFGRKTGLPVKYWDERMTSMQATRYLLEADVSRKKRKKVVDKMAAVLILQAFMDSPSNQAVVQKEL